MSTPDIVVYLKAATDVLIQRINKRNRYFERGMTREYIDGLNMAYDGFFADYKRTKVVAVDTTDMDFIESGECLQEIAERVEGSLE